MKYLKIVLTLTILSCVAQKSNPNLEDYNLLNAFLDTHNDSIILSLIPYQHDSLAPKYFFDSYLSMNSRFKTFNSKKIFFNSEEISYLNGYYKNWDTENWTANKLTHKNVSFIDRFKKDSLVELSAGVYEIVSNYKKKVYSVSKPFYNKDGKKAFLLINIYSQNEGNHGAGLGLVKMKKIRGKWKCLGFATI